MFCMFLLWQKSRIKNETLYLQGFRRKKCIMPKPKKSFLFLQKKRKCERLLLKKTGFGHKKQVLRGRNGFSMIYKILLTY